MNFYAILDADGFVQRVNVLPSPPAVSHWANVTSIWTGALPSPPYFGAKLKVVDGDWAWVEGLDLEEARALKNEEINAARLAASRGTFTYNDKEFAADELARSDIDGINGYVVLMNDFPPNWPGGWRAVDGSIVEITTVAHWQAFYQAMVVQGVDFFLYAQSLKAALAAAESLQEVSEIEW
jgi:hypothetical protein